MTTDCMSEASGIVESLLYCTVVIADIVKLCLSKEFIQAESKALLIIK